MHTKYDILKFVHKQKDNHPKHLHYNTTSLFSHDIK